MNKLNKIFIVVIIILTIFIGILMYLLHSLNYIIKTDADNIQRLDNELRRKCNELDECRLKYYELTGESTIYM